MKKKEVQMMNNRNKTSAIIFILSIFILSVFFLFPSSSFSAEKSLPSYLTKALKKINPNEVYELCKIISSSEFAGRLTGDEGYTKAAQWAAKKFKRWNLQPAFQASFLQPYPSPFSLIDEAEMSLLLPGQESHQVTKLKPIEDFLPLLFSDSGDHAGEAVFVGWGISAPDLGYDDYAGLDVQGKFVLCFRGTPNPQDKRFQLHDEHRHRMKVAREKGALGLIYIYPNPLANPNGDRIEGFTPAIISEKIADLILKEKGINAAELKKDLQKYQKPLSFPLKTKIHLQVKTRFFPEGKGYNIVGLIPGSHPNLKKEWLIYGAHFDHCGKHLGQIFPGADDNASGSAVVMAIAQAMARLKPRPKRSVAFILFGGEEMGLQGSQYFVAHPPQKIETMEAMFNFDMVGEGDGAIVIHSPQPEELVHSFQKADEYLSLIIRTAPIRGVGVRGSDYASFFQKGIPCINFISNGPHLHYHLPGDTIYRINPDMLAAMAKLAFLTGYSWANR